MEYSDSSSSSLEHQEFLEKHRKYDTHDLKKFLNGFVADIRAAYNQQVRNIVQGIKKHPGMRIIHCGMGGSAIAAEVMRTYIWKEKFILESVSDYTIPGELTNKDLVIISSYSGNTEEAQSCYRQARGVGAQVIVITSGGSLAEATSTGTLPLIKLPKGYPPRSALPHMFFTLLRVFEEIGLITKKTDEVQELIDKFRSQSLDDFAIDLSGKLYGKIPLIYSSNRFYSIAYRWKTQVNENAKSVAFSNKFPELDHNEITGFQIKNGIFHAVMLTSDADSSRMRKRMQISKELLQKNQVSVTELNVKGSVLTKIFTAIYAGDLTSYYLALRYHVDPLPVDTIEQLKRQMGPFI